MNEASVQFRANSILAAKGPVSGERKAKPKGRMLLNKRNSPSTFGLSLTGKKAGMPAATLLVMTVHTWAGQSTVFNCLRAVVFGLGAGGLHRAVKNGCV